MPHVASPVVKKFAVAAILAMFCASCGSAPRPAAEPRPVHGTSVDVRFATWNICAQFCPMLAPWPVRVKGVADQIKASGATVVAVQETGNAGDQTAKLTDSLGPAWTKAAGGKSRYLYFNNTVQSNTSSSGTPYPGGSFGVRVGRTSHLSVVAWQVFRNKASNSLFAAVDLHLTTSDGLTQDDERLAEAQEAVAKIKSLVVDKFPGIPVVYLGDLNSLMRHHDPRYVIDLNRFRVNEYFNSLGFTDVRTRAVHISNGSVDGINQLPDDHRLLGPAFVLDHIYTLRSYSVSDWKSWFRPVPYAEQYSDHNMLTASVNLPAY